jgi:apolipoprotein N-acyltransferase
MTQPYSSFNRGAAQQAPLEARASAFPRASVTRTLRGNCAPALRTATMLVNVTNDAWFGHSDRALPASADFAHARHEAGRPMVRGRRTTVFPR